VAVFPPEAAREDLRRRLPPGARFARPSKWHVTLAFLGEVDDFRVPDAADALATLPAPRPFRLRLTGCGRFGSVVWTGVRGDLGRLTELRESVRLALATAGFPIDPRPFRPHLTLSYRPEPTLLPALDGYTGPDWPIPGFALVQSLQGNYETLQTWPTP